MRPMWKAQGAVHHSSEPASSCDGHERPVSPELSSRPAPRWGSGNRTLIQVQSGALHGSESLLHPISAVSPHRYRHLLCPRKPQHYLRNKNVQVRLCLHPQTRLQRIHISISSHRKLHYINNYTQFYNLLIMILRLFGKSAIELSVDRLLL